MAIHWQIPFKSLRSGSDYCVNILDAFYSGSPIPLKGGAQPFTTDEDADEDEFTPVRTQSGYIRIVDDGKDANGNAFNWKTLIPTNDIDRPVTLTKKVGSSWVIQWQGFMQSQNFGAALYGNPQEMEFPVQCCLQALNSLEVATDVDNLYNFAYLLYNSLVTRMPTHSFTSFVIQGGQDAQRWLLKKFDWQVFLRESDGTEEDLEPAYSVYQALEDMCRFWGWTLRTKGQTVYLTRADDADEPYMLTLTQAQLQTMAGGTSAGTTSGDMTTIAMSGDIFASTNNDNYQDRGPNKATVKASVQEHNVMMECFPPSVHNHLDRGTWTWHQHEGEDMVGYFESSQITSFGSAVDTVKSSLMQGYISNGNNAHFSLRQVYTDAESEDAAKSDMICIKHIYNGSQFASIQTKKPMTYAGGSLRLSGTVYFGDYVCDWAMGTCLKMRLGIGLTRQTAKWWYMSDTVANPSDIQLVYGWSTTMNEFRAPVNGGNIKSTGFRNLAGVIYHGYSYDSIPTPANQNLQGYLFIDFLGLQDELSTYKDVFQIADFKIEFSRDMNQLPTSTGVVRGRTMKIERVSSKEYMEEIPHAVKYEWNADCIFASDWDFNYGFGLVMEPDGTFMGSALYHNGSTPKPPEQHLVERVKSFWTTAKRRLTVELRSDAITEPTPANKVSLDGTTFHPLAISHDWRDDIVKLTLLQIQ